MFRLRAEQAGKLVIPDQPEQSERISGQIRSLWGSDLCEFRQCLNCGYGFARPYIAGNEEIYSSLYYKHFSYPEDKWEYEQSLGIIRQLDLPDHPALLELGAGNGSFLDRLSSLGFPSKGLFSTEFSASGAEEIRKKGYHCSGKALRELTDEELPRFDVICMFQVLEHMDDIHRVFRSLQQLGKPGSHLIIAVPNGHLRSFYDTVGVHLDVPPIHVGRFTGKTFSFLAGQHGWEVGGLYFEPQSYSFRVKKFLSDRYVRVTFTRRTERSASGFVTYFFRYLCLLGLTLRFLPVILYLLLPRKGTSLLVHYRKKTAPE
jgi:SAM-dependent methyltransferase